MKWKDQKCKFFMNSPTQMEPNIISIKKLNNRNGICLQDPISKYFQTLLTMKVKKKNKFLKK